MKFILFATVVIGTASLMVDVARSHEGGSVTVAAETVIVTSSGKAGRVVGDGKPGKETRSIGPVTAIDADGAFALTISVGPAPAVIVETDKNLLPIVKTDVSNGRLALSTDHSYSADRRIKITVMSPNIAAVSASGSNQIQCQGLTGGALAISLNGSNNAVLSGEISSLQVRMAGSNQLMARQLTDDKADIVISGSGTASLYARQQIAAEIAGSGSIVVYGNPQARRTQVNGSGNITFAQ